MIGHKSARLFGTVCVAGSLFGPTVASAQMNIQVVNPEGAVKCLDITNDQDFNGNPVLLWDCTPGGQPSQMWDWLPNGQIVSELDHNKCLDVNNNNGNNGAQVDIFDCVPGANNEVWNVTGVAFDHNQGRFLQSVSPGNCLDLNGSQNNFNPWFNSAKVDSWACVNGAWNESWHFSNPTSAVGISVGASSTQFGGPNICTSGHGFTGDSEVSVEYYSIPFFTGPEGPLTAPVSNGSFFLPDSTEDGTVFQNCSSDQLNTFVLVKVTGSQTNHVKIEYMPSGLFCANSPIHQFGNGC